MAMVSVAPVTDVAPFDPAAPPPVAPPASVVAGSVVIVVIVVARLLRRRRLRSVLHASGQIGVDREGPQCARRSARRRRLRLSRLRLGGLRRRRGRLRRLGRGGGAALSVGPVRLCGVRRLSGGPRAFRGLARGRAVQGFVGLRRRVRSGQRQGARAFLRERRLRGGGRRRRRPRRTRRMGRRPGRRRSAGSRRLGAVPSRASAEHADCHAYRTGACKRPEERRPFGSGCCVCTGRFSYGHMADITSVSRLTAARRLSAGLDTHSVARAAGACVCRTSAR